MWRPALLLPGYELRQENLHPRLLGGMKPACEKSLVLRNTPHVAIWIGCTDVMLMGPAPPHCGLELGLCPLVLAPISTAAPLNCMHLSSFHQAMTGYLIRGLFFNGRERWRSWQTMHGSEPSWVTPSGRLLWTHLGYFPKVHCPPKYHLKYQLI